MTSDLAKAIAEDIHDGTQLAVQAIDLADIGTRLLFEMFTIPTAMALQLGVHSGFTGMLALCPRSA